MLYKDKHGNEIKAGDYIKHDDGTVELVYATTDGFEKEGLGINATNLNWSGYKDGDAQQEFYPLISFNSCDKDKDFKLKEFEIIDDATVEVKWKFDKISGKVA